MKNFRVLSFDYMYMGVAYHFFRFDDDFYMQYEEYLTGRFCEPIKIDKGLWEIACHRCSCLGGSFRKVALLDNGDTTWVNGNL